MPILDIVRLGNPILRTPADVLDLDTLADPTTQALIDDMIETMQEADGVGLAAPQVNVPWQLFVYLAFDPDDPEVEPAVRMVVNPIVEPLAGDLLEDWEGCLSIPGMRGLVPRHAAVRVHGFDRDGAPIDYRADAFEARVIQHENDHLHGRIFLDQMHDLKSLAYNEEWEAHSNDTTATSDTAAASESMTDDTVDTDDSVA